MNTCKMTSGTRAKTEPKRRPAVTPNLDPADDALEPTAPHRHEVGRGDEKDRER